MCRSYLGCYSLCELKCVSALLWLEVIHHLWLLKSYPTLLPKFWALGEEVGEEISFRTECSKVSHCFHCPVVDLLIPFYWKKQLLWWGSSDVLNCGYSSKSLGDSLLSWLTVSLTWSVELSYALFINDPPWRMPEALVGTKLLIPIYIHPSIHLHTFVSSYVWVLYLWIQSTINQKYSA